MTLFLMQHQLHKLTENETSQWIPVGYACDSIGLKVLTPWRNVVEEIGN